MSEHQLDARGLLCPMPVIRTQQKVATLSPGDVLEVVATDPGVLQDIPAWCRVHGHDVLETVRNDREIAVRLRVNGA
jgi:tRNA 2-thiouridine synthesizing protein A